MENSTALRGNHTRGTQRIFGNPGNFDHFSGTIELYKALFAIIDGLGILGNILVIATIFLNPNMRSTIYYFLANLAFSDLFFAILAPFHITMLVDQYNSTISSFVPSTASPLLTSFSSPSSVSWQRATRSRSAATPAAPSRSSSPRGSSASSSPPRSSP